MERLLLAIVLVEAAVFVTGVQVHPGMRTFSYAIKDGSILANTEKVLYEYESQAPKPGGCGVITEQWFTGKRVTLVYYNK